ncbi:hypothetical protein TIFTF001_016389 [Ficus carica]|uniref:Uncharacterized protein n=1 Tax=Ficus carica TaxID=3494 RepID=A0AA88A310_FICCA|nr:hypothetical protein TIFTF001_016389 [Ficus carica]
MGSCRRSVGHEARHCGEELGPVVVLVHLRGGGGVLAPELVAGEEDPATISASRIPRRNKDMLPSGGDILD